MARVKAEEVVYDFEKDLLIDQHALDEEWLGQPALMMRYSALSAKAQDKLRRSEQALKVLRSELVLEASEQGEAVLGKGVKPTAAAVEAYYRNHKEHQEAKEDFFKAALEAEMLQNAVFAFQARKSALENLVRLHGQQYFSTPNTEAMPAEQRERVEGAVREGRVERQRKRLNPED